MLTNVLNILIIYWLTITEDLWLIANICEDLRPMQDFTCILCRNKFDFVITKLVVINNSQLSLYM